MKHAVDLDSEAKLRLRVMDAHERMKIKNVSYLCALFGVSRSWFYKWKKQYNPRNISTLKSHSRRPKKIKTVDWGVVIEVCEWKRLHPKKSHYYLYNLWLKQGKTPPCSPKTIYNWWKRRNLIISRYKRKRVKTKLFNCASVPGELIQIDTKHLAGKKYQYTGICVVSKWRFALGYRAFNTQNSIDFVDRLILKAGLKGVTIKLIQTDNGPEFGFDLKQYVESLGIKHQYIWIHTPDQNGCVERSHRTDEEEFYQETDIDYTDLEDLNIKLEAWINYYNKDRLHFGINFDTPEEYLQKFKVSTI